MTKLLRHKYFLVGSKCWAEASKGVRERGRGGRPHNIVEPTLSRHRDEEEPPNIIATSSQYVTRLRLRLSLSRHCRCASKWLIKTFLHITSISTLNLMAGSTSTHQDESGRERDGNGGTRTRTAEPTTSRSRITSSSSNNKHRNSNGNTSRNMLLTLHSGAKAICRSYTCIWALSEWCLKDLRVPYST